MSDLSISRLWFKCTAALGAACWLGAAAQGQTIRLHGATSLEKLVNAQKTAIESQAGVKLEVVGNGAGRGLADLCAGQAELAMIAGPLKSVAEAMNVEKPGSVETVGLKEIPVTSVKIAFATHPSAGVKSLTEAQLRDVLSGKATNWKEVGGADLPIKVVIAFAGDGARITVRETVLAGTDYAKSAIVRTVAKDLAAVLAQLPGACSALSVKNVEGNVTVVSVDKDLAMPLQLVAKGEPTAEVTKVVDAVKATIK